MWSLYLHNTLHLWILLVVYQSESYSYLVSTESHVMLHPLLKIKKKKKNPLWTQGWHAGSEARVGLLDSRPLLTQPRSLHTPLKLKVYLVNDKVKNTVALSEATVRVGAGSVSALMCKHAFLCA